AYEGHCQIAGGHGRLARDDDLAVSLDRNGAGTLLREPAGEVGGELALVTEARVEGAIGIEPREHEVDELAAHHDDLAVSLYRHVRLVAEAGERRLALRAEGFV